MPPCYPSMDAVGRFTKIFLLAALTVSCTDRAPRGGAGGTGSEQLGETGAGGTGAGGTETGGTGTGGTGAGGTGMDPYGNCTQTIEEWCAQATGPCNRTWPGTGPSSPLCDLSPGQNGPSVGRCGSYLLASYSGVDTTTTYYYDANTLDLTAVIFRYSFVGLGPYCIVGPPGATALTFLAMRDCSQISPDISCPARK